MSEQTKKKSIYQVTSQILNELSYDLDSSRNKAILSNLRNTITRPYSQAIDVFSLIYEYMPEEFIGKNYALSFEEKAIITSLRLYAIHQQGKVSNILDIDKEDQYKNMGYDLRALRVDDHAKASDRRFNTMISADTFDQFTFHLRQLVNLLKSRTDQKVSYAKLAQDLYYFQIPQTREKIRLSWAREYYRYINKDHKKGEDNDK